VARESIARRGRLPRRRLAARQIARDRSAKKIRDASKKSLTKKNPSFTVLARKEVPSAMAAKKKKATTKKSSAKKTTKKGKK
jgi:hypothetical protein